METKTLKTAGLGITDFLLARIAEDESAANRARALQDYMPPGAWDLDRVLAECDAKRRIVEIHSWQATDYYWPDGPGRVQGNICAQCGGLPNEPCETLKALVATYANDPDCRIEWY